MKAEERIYIPSAIIVEGRYDKAKLSGIFDALIIETGGFSIRHNKSKLELIRSLAEKTGIIILTDSDKAGMAIRSFIRDYVKSGSVIDVFLPEIHGREKRKDKNGAEGLLGVEGIDDEIIVDAFCRAGVPNAAKPDSYGKALLHELSICGGKNSSFMRERLCERLMLPKSINTNTLARILPTLISEAELRELMKQEEFIYGKK